MTKSIYFPSNKDDVRREYAASSTAANTYEKMKWGSHESMVNRFHLAHRIVNWDAVHSWLDIGCGTGLMFKVLEDAGHRFDRLAGIDLSPEMIAQARRDSSLASPAEFVVADGEQLPHGFQGAFDLVTMIGVLQKCGTEPRPFLAHALTALRSGGQFFMTTKHIGWRAFREEGLAPEVGHSWFEHEEIVRHLESLGASVRATGGFVPRTNEVVPIEDAHTIYFLAERT